MSEITPINEYDIKELVKVARTTFLEAHEKSASRKDLDVYLEKHYTEKALQEDINDPKTIYRIIQQEGNIVGFSKIILDHPHPDVKNTNVTKMERVYVLEAFHGKRLGPELFNLNLKIAKEHHQCGIWLYTWTGNHRAIAFYEKKGFEIIGHHDFKISEKHSNPNHLMWLPL